MTLSGPQGDERILTMGAEYGGPPQARWRGPGNGPLAALSPQSLPSGVAVMFAADSPGDSFRNASKMPQRLIVDVHSPKEIRNKFLCVAVFR
jgi:hypothetical protein